MVPGARAPAQGAEAHPSLALQLYPEPSGSVDIEAVRRACAAGELEALPAWVRTHAYRLLLGYLAPDKPGWLPTLRQSREAYVQFLADLSDDVRPSSRSPDRVLGQVYHDLFRAAEADPDFYDSRAAWPAAEQCTRHVLLERLERINDGFRRAAARDRPPHARFVDRQWHAMLRILFMYAMLNPSVGYIQGMNEVLYVLLRAFFATRDLAPEDIPPAYAEVLGLQSTAHAEADAFWCFSLLIGGLREVYDFGHGDTTTFAAMRSLAEPLPAQARLPDNGLAAALHRMSAQLQRLDPPLAEMLASYQLDPRLPYFSLRWLVCLYATEFPWPNVLAFWDVLLAQKHDRLSTDGTTNEQIAFLIDIGCAMLLYVRRALLALPQATPDVFAHGMHLLQSYPEHSARHVLTLARDLLVQRHTSCALPRNRQGRRDPPVPTRTSRNTSLQERLAATVQRSLQSPTRSATWTPGTPMQHGPTTRTPSLSATPAAPTTTTASATTPATPDQAEAAHVPYASPTHTASPEPATPSMASSGRALFRRYTEALQDSNAAASVSKAGTNLAARALAWRASSGPQPSAAPSMDRTPSASGAPQMPIPTVVDSPEDRDAYRSIARVRAGLPATTTPEPLRRGSVERSPSTSEDDSFVAGISSPSHLSLPSMRKAAQLGLLRTPPPSDTPYSAPLTSGETSPNLGASLTRRIPSGQRGVRRKSSERSRRSSDRSSDQELHPMPSISTIGAFQGLPPVLPTPAQNGSGPVRHEAESAQGAGHTSEHLDALLHELQTTEWIKEN